MDRGWKLCHVWAAVCTVRLEANFPRSCAYVGYLSLLYSNSVCNKEPGELDVPMSNLLNTSEISAR